MTPNSAHLTVYELTIWPVGRDPIARFYINDLVNVERLRLDFEKLGYVADVESHRVDNGTSAARLLRDMQAAES